MTENEIIEMAVQAGVVERDGCGLFVCSTEVSELVEFAALVAAKEREACAAACDALQAGTLAAQSGTADDLPNVMLRQVAHLGAGECARAIRARSQQ